MDKGFKLFYSYEHKEANVFAKENNLKIQFLMESCGTNGDSYIVYKDINDITVNWLKEATIEAEKIERICKQIYSSR